VVIGFDVAADKIYAIPHQTKNGTVTEEVSRRARTLGLSPFTPAAVDAAMPLFVVKNSRILRRQQK
jgi:hypothetical protein